MTSTEATEESGRHLRMVVAYDGTEFHGFAENDGVRTVGGVLREAIESVPVTASS